MASANLDLVRSICADWERGDFTAAKWAHPEIEYVFVDGVTAGSWRGLLGMAEAWRDFLNAWEEARYVPDEYRELDDERVLVLFHFTGRGKASGLDAGRLRTSGANVFHLSNGTVTRLATYWDRDRAFADLGLDPEAGPRHA